MIPVEWWNLHDECNPRAHWDTAWLQAVFAGRVCPPTRRFDAFCEAMWGPDFPAVVMVAGNFHADDVEQLNRAIGNLPGVVVIVHSDEEAVFPVEHLEHPNMRLWVQTPRVGRAYPEGTRFFGEGWSPWTPEILSAWGEGHRVFDVGFAGQVTHRRREEMMIAFSSPNASGLCCDLYPTPGFTQGMERAEYLHQLQRARVALCPSGPATQDSFRVWEALEAGCVPLVDDVTPDGRSGYWEFILGETPPFPLIADWSTAPNTARMVLGNFERVQVECQTWWRSYQQRLVDQLRADVEAVRA